MGILTGKACVVTGAGGGIGLAIASAFAEAGATVAMLDINSALVTASAAGLPDGRGRAYVVDIRDRQAVKTAVDDFAGRQGGLDVLVNNAVAFSYAPLVQMAEDVVDLMIDVGLKGTIWSLQAATPHLIARKGGVVINLSSVAVSFGIRNAAVYSSIKGALDTLTRQQAIELGPHGIRVNAIAPGPVSTPGANTVIDEQGWREREGRTPLRRLATPDEVGAAALYLASDAARSVTGVTLKIDAGITITGV